jgi:hypothetical protein
MKTLTVAIAVLLASPALAQTKPKPISAAQVDPCAPIGRTADGRFVYSLKCEKLPVPVAPQRADAGAVGAAPAPVAEEEEDKGGLFKNPFPSLIKPTNIQQTPGVGPAAVGR